MAVNSFNAQNPPVTTKGDLFTFSTIPTRLGVGANNTVLTADSATATGLKWAAAPGANWTLLNAGGTALTGAATITVSGISNVDKIMVLVSAASSANVQSTIRFRVDTLTTSIYNYYGMRIAGNATYSAGIFVAQDTTSNTSVELARMANDAASTVSGGITLTGCASSGVKQFTYVAAANVASADNTLNYSGQGFISTSNSLTSISLNSSSGNFDNGTVFVYTSP